MGIKEKLSRISNIFRSETEFRHSAFAAIVLITDFGDDLAPAECRLSLRQVFRENRAVSPEIIVVNDVLPYNKTHAAFTIDRLVESAPPEIIIIGVIDPGVGTQRKSVIVQTQNNHYFIGPDNGILYPGARRDGILKIWQIDRNQFPHSSTTFHGRDVFSKVAALIACGARPDLLGSPINELMELHFLHGQIVHIDAYGNLKIYGPVPQNANHLSLPEQNLDVPFVRTFEDVAVGQPLAYIGSSGLLEIAVREGSAARFLGCNVGNCLDIRLNSSV